MSSRATALTASTAVSYQSQTMPLRLPRLACAFFAAALLLAPSGCIKKLLTDGQIQSTRLASASFDTLGDYELARSAAQAGLAQFEGMHSLEPENADALFLLVKGWSGYGYGFVEDEMESAEDAGDADLAEYHKKRARMAYDRAVFYGLALLAQKAAGFDAAKKSQPALARWLSQHFESKEDVPALFWTGYAWIARADLMKGDEEEGPAFVAELHVAVALLERSEALDPGFEHSSASVTLAAYHARTNLAELGESKRLFDRALTRTEGRSLLVPFTYATKYACVKGDRALYQDLLGRVLDAQDPDPGQRLANATAKRRARRWLRSKRAKERCGIDLAAPAAVPPAAPAL
ncbi:MAG: TRAP transporter TatT component family protein [Myxococcota bacterium]|nr:TRAP transporter TatT component family protein [Myxococcota bacterium]